MAFKNDTREGNNSGHGIEPLRKADTEDLSGN